MLIVQKKPSQFAEARLQRLPFEKSAKHYESVHESDKKRSFRLTQKVLEEDEQFQISNWELSSFSSDDTWSLCFPICTETVRCYSPRTFTSNVLAILRDEDFFILC